METIKSDDVKARLLELPHVPALQADHRIMVDSPTLRGGHATSGAVVQRAHVDLVQAAGTPTGAASVLLLDGGVLKRYNLLAATGNENLWYLGPFPAPPLRTPTGFPLLPGHQYFNTTDKQVYIFVGSGESEGWKPYGVPYPANSQHYYFHTGVDIQEISGADEIGNELTFDSIALDDIEVYVNGVKLIFNSDFVLLPDNVIQFTGVITGNSVIEVIVQKRITLDYTVTPFYVDTQSWVFDGVQKTFPLMKRGGGLLVPGSSTNTLLCMDGKLRDPVKDYQVFGSDLIFYYAPTPGGTVWMLVGLPIIPDYLFNVVNLASQEDTFDLHGTFVDDGTGEPVIFSGEGPMSE